MNRNFGMDHTGTFAQATFAPVSRRHYLGRWASAPALVVGDAMLRAISITGHAVQGEILFDHKRAQEALKLRVKRAVSQRLQPAVTHSNDGNEERYANYIGNFS